MHRRAQQIAEQEVPELQQDVQCAERSHAHHSLNGFRLPQATLDSGFGDRELVLAMRAGNLCIIFFTSTILGGPQKLSSHFSPFTYIPASGL